MRNKPAGTALLSSVLISLAVTACVAYHPLPLAPRRIESEFEARRLDDPGVREFLDKNLAGGIAAWPPQSWDFDTLSLAALYYHPDMDVARARFGVAEAGVVAAGGRPNPSAGVLPGYDVNPPSGISPWILSFSLAVPLETAGKRGYRIAGARELSEAARLNIASAAWKVRSRVRSRMLDLYDAEETDTLLNRETAVLAELATAEQQLFRAGEVSRFELTRARIVLDRTNLALKEAQKNKAESLTGLAAAVGLPPGALIGVQLSFDTVTGLPAQRLADGRTLTAVALSNRSDVLSLLADYAASQSALQLEIAKQYPDVSIGPAYTWDQGENKWFLGLTLPLPVFNRNRGPIARAEARRKETAARFKALEDRVIGEVGSALAGYEAAKDKLAAADALLQAREKSLNATEQMLEAGEVSKPDLLNSRLEYLAASLSGLKAQVEAARALGLLEDAVERPLPLPGPEGNP